MLSDGLEISRGGPHNILEIEIQVPWKKMQRYGYPKSGPTFNKYFQEVSKWS